MPRKLTGRGTKVSPKRIERIGGSQLGLGNRANESGKPAVARWLQEHHETKLAFDDNRERLRTARLEREAAEMPKLS